MNVTQYQSVNNYLQNLLTLLTHLPTYLLIYLLKTYSLLVLSVYLLWVVRDVRTSKDKSLVLGTRGNIRHFQNKFTIFNFFFLSFNRCVSELSILVFE